MARGQGAAGRRGPGTALSQPLVIHVHDLGQARAALAAARASGATPSWSPARDLAAFAGVGFWHAVATALGQPVVIDCGDDAGLAMAALREGCRDLLFTGPEAIAVKLDSMAAQLGGRLRRRLDGDVVALLAEDDPARVLAY